MDDSAMIAALLLLVLILVFSLWGIQGDASMERRVLRTITSCPRVRASELCSILVVRKGARWTLAPNGIRLLDLLTY